MPEVFTHTDRVIEVGDVGDQGFHVDAPAGHEIEEARQVAALGPTHVADRVVVAAFLVRGVVAARTVGAGEADLQLLMIKVVPRRVQADHAQDDDPPPVAAEVAWLVPVESVAVTATSSVEPTSWLVAT